MTEAKWLRFHLCQPPVPPCSTCDRKEIIVDLAKLNEKYNPLKKKQEVIEYPPVVLSSSDRRLESWKDSAPVVRLSEYLKIHKDQGITLHQRDGSPILSFNPGVSQHETERWKIAQNAALLLIDAADDLKYLIANGLIDIPFKPGAAIPTINAAGPSQASDLHG